MSTHKSSSITNQRSHEIITTLKPALASINTAREYMGNPSRSKFYADVLPNLETIKFSDNDKRRWVIVASMDRLIAARCAATAEIAAGDAGAFAQAAVRADLDRLVPDRDAADHECRRTPNIRGRRNA